MKRLFGLALLALALSGVTAEAQYIRIIVGDCHAGKVPVGPWYLYWPLEAHFQAPASPQYPFWPAPMMLPHTAKEVAGFNPYGGMQGPAMGGYSPYAAMGNPGMPMAGNGYNPYGAGYGTNPSQGAPVLPASRYPNGSAPIYRTGY